MGDTVSPVSPFHFALNPVAVARQPPDL